MLYHSTKQRLLLLISCLVLTIMTYSPGLGGDFIFDDFPNIIFNKDIELKSLDLDNLVSASLSSNAGKLKRPISMFSFALNRYYSGLEPYSYKVTNLIIHLLTGLVIFFLTKQILQAYHFQRKSEPSKDIFFYLPLAVSALWLVHPLNLTSVLYIVQRMNSLSSLFVLLGCYSYIKLRQRYLVSNRQFWMIPAGVALWGMLATFSKENGILLAIFILLIEAVLFKFKNQENVIDKKVTIFFTCIVLLPVIFTFYTLLTQPNFFLGGYRLRDFNMTERLMTEARVLMFYLQMIILPSNEALGLFHDDIAISRDLFNPGTTLPAIIGIISLFSLGLYLLKKYPPAGFGIVWFFTAHLLESTFIPLEIAHEHRNYIAIYGIIFALLYCLYDLSSHIKKSFIYFTSLCLIGVLSWTTYIRAGQWSDNVLHAIIEAEHHPDSDRAVFSAGRIYANLSIFTKLDKSKQAFEMLERSRKLNKTGILPNISLILLSYKLNKPIDPAWLDDTEYKLKNYPLHPTSLKSLHELVKCQAKQCKLTDDQMNRLFTLALNNDLLTNSGEPHPDVVTSYAYHAINNKRDIKLGYKMFLEAIRLNPTSTQYRLNIVNLLLLMKQYDKVNEHIAYLKENNTLGKHSYVIELMENDLAKSRAINIDR